MCVCACEEAVRDIWLARLRPGSSKHQKNRDDLLRMRGTRERMRDMRLRFAQVERSGLVRAMVGKRHSCDGVSWFGNFDHVGGL